MPLPVSAPVKSIGSARVNLDVAVELKIAQFAADLDAVRAADQRESIGHLVGIVGAVDRQRSHVSHARITGDVDTRITVVARHRGQVIHAPQRIHIGLVVLREYLAHGPIEAHQTPN